MRTLLLALTKVRPLVGLVTGKFENNGIWLPVVVLPARDIARGQTAHRGRRSSDCRSAADRGFAVAPTETKLGADIAGEAAGCGHDAGFNFHFLGLAVKLRQQAVDGRHHRRNVLDDQSIGPVVRDNVAALGEEILHRGDDILGVRVAQETGDRDFVHRQSLGFHLGAP